VAKMNISIPDDLRERMRPFDAETNWSDLAAAAFKQKVENAEYLASIRPGVKRRIMTTEIEDIGGVEKFAHRDGQHWAENHARMSELRRLAAHLERDGVDLGSWRALVNVILGDRFDGHHQDWVGPQSQFGGRVVTTYEEQYANAFAEGAMEVFEAVGRPE
jgi:hypothetical protein